jgi:diacylglycerol kinase family enzyme
LLRRHPLKGNVIYRQVKHVTFEADRPVASQVDGDPGPSTPLDIRVTDQRIVLLVPPKHAAWSFWPFTGA